MKDIGPKKILIIKLLALGDILQTTPAIRLLKQNHPTYLIDHLVFEPYKGVTQNNKYVNRVITVNKNKVKLKTFLYVFRLLNTIRTARYDVIINFHPNRTIRFVCKFLGSKKVLHTNPSMKMIKRYNGAIFQEVISNNFEGISVGIDNQIMDFFINDKNVSDYFRNSLPPDFICIQAGGGNNLGESSTIRRWPVEKYVDLVKLIRGRSSIAILLTGNSADYEIAHAIESGFAGITNFCGKTNLDELAFLFSKSRLNISGDTGAMHVAGTTETPLIALFGPTDPVKMLPRRDEITLIKTSVNCSPCYFGTFEGCKSGQENCMKAIDVETVFDCVKKYL
jgi:ADP-heptose:LPS heptosyltransferase